MSTLSRGEIHWVDGSYPGNRMNLDRTVSIVDQYAQTIRNWVDSGVIRYALEITVINSLHTLIRSCCCMFFS